MRDGYRVIIVVVQFKLHYGEKYTAMSEITLALPDRERVPDLGIYPKVHYNPSDEEIRMTEMPLCAIEILSPKQAVFDLIIKSKEYFDAGVKSYWLVNPLLENVHVFSDYETRTYYGKNDILGDENLGIEFKTADIFS